MAVAYPPDVLHAASARRCCPALTHRALASPAGQALSSGSRLCSSSSSNAMRGLSALARRAAQARQVMVVRGGGGGPLAKPLPPSQALMEEDEL